MLISTFMSVKTPVIKKLSDRARASNFDGKHLTKKKLHQNIT